MNTTNAVWLPKNLTPAGQMILAVPTSKTQKMDRFLLQMAVANKIVRMAREEDLQDEDVLQLLQTDPDLMTAIGPLTETRPMAEAVLSADNLSNLIFQADLTSKPTREPQSLQDLTEQTLESWVASLNRASQEN